MAFQQSIIKWYLQNKRDLPWRHTTDAYVIWLSEIILQQTRVEQGLPYFERFLMAYPTVIDFARATEDEILKLWQGLGYYSRGRNMLKTAKQVVEEYGGSFPNGYHQLLQLKGIGSYTAAAIASFSGNHAHAVVDGNVYRVLSRYFGLSEPINSIRGKKLFARLANELMVNQAPALYNQAIMEFGALQCKPKSPNCSNCTIATSCFALKNKQVQNLPVKEKKLSIKHRYFNYFVVQDGAQIWGRKRTAADIWQHLYDFPLIETPHHIAQDAAEVLRLARHQFGANTSVRLIETKKHVLTHQVIFVHFFALANYIANFNEDSNIKAYAIEAFKLLPHPKVIGDFLADHII